MDVLHYSNIPWQFIYKALKKEHQSCQSCHKAENKRHNVSAQKTTEKSTKANKRETTNKLL